MSLIPVSLNILFFKLFTLDVSPHPCAVPSILPQSAMFPRLKKPVQLDHRTRCQTCRCGPQVCLADNSLFQPRHFSFFFAAAAIATATVAATALQLSLIFFRELWKLLSEKVAPLLESAGYKGPKASEADITALLKFYQEKEAEVSTAFFLAL